MRVLSFYLNSTIVLRTEGGKTGAEAKKQVGFGAGVTELR